MDDGRDVGWFRKGIALLSLAGTVVWVYASLVPRGVNRPMVQEAASSVPVGYHMTFEENFSTLSISDDGATAGMRDRWYTHTVQCCLYDTSRPSTPTHMAGIGAPMGENPYSLIPGGGLRIRLQRHNGAWYSGVLATVDGTGRGFSQRYGYFEMKARFPAAVGSWPAFWLLNAAALSEHAPAGEIDVVEAYMFAPRSINITLHDWTPPAKMLGHALRQVSDLTAGYHTFGLLWTAETMTFYCDGVSLYRVPTPAIMHQPYYPIVDLGLGGGWPTDQMPEHADMEVASVRVYAADTGR